MRTAPVGGPSRCAGPAALAVILLLVTTGFRFGVGSDFYIVSLLWPLARLVADDGNARTLFLAGYVITLALYFLALLYILFRLGMREWPALLLAGVLLGLTYLDSGHSFLAGANIVGGSFTETQVATALVTVSLALALNRRMVWALLVLGVAFDARYEVALWGAAALLAVTVALAWDKVAIRRDCAIGAPIALLLAAPAIVWLAWNITSSGHLDGGFLAYGGRVEPSQWLASTASLQQWVMFVSMLALGLSAFSVLGPRAKLLAAAFLGFLAVFVIGCLLPLVTDNQWLLTLRPVAADSFMQVLATVGAVAVVVQDMRYGGMGRVALSLVIAASLLLSEFALPIGALAMLARAALAHGEMLGIERRMRPFNQRTVHRMATPALLLIAVAGGVLRVTQPPPWIEPAPQERLQSACHAGVVYYADRATDGFDLHAPTLRPSVVFDQDGYFVVDARRYCAR